MKKISIFASLLVLLVLVNISNAGIVYASRTIIVTPPLVLPVIHGVQGQDTLVTYVQSNAYIITVSSPKPVDTLTTQVVWGDGTQSMPQVYITTANQQIASFFWHTYTLAGNKTLIFKCTNSDGTVIQTKIVHVKNLLPVIVSFTGPATLTTSQAGTFNMSGRDPNGTTLTFSVNWGDGTTNFTSTKTGTVNQTLSDQTTHAYATASTYYPTLTLTDANGGTATRTLTVVVNPALPPVIDSFTVPVTAVQGSSVNMTLVCHDNDSQQLNIDVNFGDNTPHFTATRTGSLGQIFTIEFSHTFITLGQFVITVAVSDTSGGQSVVVFGGGQ